MKKIKKILQNIFKIFFYKAFILFYGKIKGKTDSENDSRIKIETIKKKNNIKYKIYKIKNGRLYTDRIHDAAIILNNLIVEGPSYQLRTVNNAPVEENIIFHKGTPRIKKNLNGNVLSLLTGGAGNDNYFHWLFDVLPRLALCEQILDLQKIDFFLFPSTEKKFQKETLDLLNIPNKKQISSKSFRHISSPEIFVTDHPYVLTNNASNDIQNIPIWISEWLREKYINSETDKDLSFPKKIYIDRSESESNSRDLRLIVNENEIKRFLIDKGFKPIILGNYHFKDQVKFFNNAECIIGLHGGGFANLCFCKSRTKVIELKSNTFGKVIENLAKANGLNYNAVSSESVKYKNNNQLGHIKVSLDSLNEAIKI